MMTISMLRTSMSRIITRLKIILFQRRYYKVFGKAEIVVNVTINFNVIRNKFHDELDRFTGHILPISAWIIYVRRNNLRPNLNNVNLSKMFVVNDELTIERQEQTEIPKIFERMCGVELLKAVP